MSAVTDFIVSVNDVYWYGVIALLVGAGLYFSVTTLIVQIRMFPEMLKTIVEKPSDIEEDKKGISAFRAFTISAASRVGTGNVAGVAIAITVGGPGAVFWMWLLAIIGGATAFIESTLAQLYKVKGRDSYVGGPAYYIRDGLGWKPVAVLFAVIITVTYGFVFNAVQANSIAQSVRNQFSLEGFAPGLIIGLVLALVVGVVIFGGIRRLSAVTEIIVPVMAVAYIIVALVVVALNISEVPGMISLIVGHALGFREVAGAAVGAAIMQGMRRGLFSNEAGMGSVPNAAATASVSHPVKQGLVQALGVYFDTIVVCSATAFIILLANPEFGGDREGITLTQNSLAASVGDWGVPFLTVVIFFLAFSSILGNSYYGEANITFLRGNPASLLTFRLLVILAVLGGSLGSVDLIWNLADLFMGVMATINLIAIIPLGGLAVALLQHYLQQKAKGHNPVFHRDDLPRARNVTCWDGSDPMTLQHVANQARDVEPKA
ncbi:sodium:alanine symporter family protein [uncultured Dietzia sp.]|uniref:alanine/glycine:cation symporter family protein n=1 Tax=uncultured Dietzia sp. TaxID=395519 RepID=UPI00263A0166|nr:alanine/glycine:cation symporter family protein [uncultured Dietzia sp.]HMT49147.1 alanine/glycine:cation symporter family protein [Dietzia sp.]